MDNSRRPIISFDFKTRYRIRIHKITLHLLGDPDYIQLLVNPFSKIIAIRKGNSDDHLSIKIRNNRFSNDCFEIFSKQLMRSIMLVYEDLEYGSSYRIYGDMDPNNEIAIFSINDVVKIKDNNDELLSS